MKLTSGYVIREIGGNFIAVPVEQNQINYKEMIHTNETGSYILEQLRAGVSYEDLLEKMVIKYEATESEREILKNDLDDFLYHVKLFHLAEA